MNEDFGRVPAPGWRDRHGPDRRPCLCGGEITYPFLSHETLAAVVLRHNRGGRHRWWWARVREDWQ